MEERLKQVTHEEVMNIMEVIKTKVGTETDLDVETNRIKAAEIVKSTTISAETTALAFLFGGSKEAEGGRATTRSGVVFVS